MWNTGMIKLNWVMYVPVFDLVLPACHTHSNRLISSAINSHNKFILLLVDLQICGWLPVSYFDMCFFNFCWISIECLYTVYQASILVIIFFLIWSIVDLVFCGIYNERVVCYLAIQFMKLKWRIWIGFLIFFFNDYEINIS